MIKVFEPYQEKISADFLGAPKNFVDRKHTNQYFQKKNPTLQKIYQPFQTHSNIVLLDKEHKENISCDGVYTKKRNIICSVKTADCIGGLFYNPQNNTIAAIHAGWRGLAQKIFTNFLKQYTPKERRNFRVALSPSLGKCCAQFSDPFHETPDFFHPFITTRHPARSEAKMRDLFFVDLWGIAKKELLNEGILEKNIQMPTICTKCDAKKRFWSHRNGNTERNISYIFLK